MAEGTPPEAPTSSPTPPRSAPVERYVRAADLPRDQLRAVIRGSHAFDPPLRILAEDVLGADSTIDLVTVDPEGRIILVLVGDRDEDSMLLTRGLAQRAWVKPRLRDWLQLSPDLAISASAPVVARLLSPSFSPEARAAADALGADAIELCVCRAVHNGTQTGVLLEPLAVASPAGASPDPAPDEAGDGSGATGQAGTFRSGLSEEDLGLTSEEIRDFD